MAYIFVNEDLRGDTVISSLSDLEESDLNIIVRDELDYLPCYVVHLTGAGHHDDQDDLDICKLLDFVVKEVYNNYGDDCMLTFSVTSRENAHKDWLDAGARYPSAQVQEIHRPLLARATGQRYTCYFVTIPVSDKPLF